MCWEYSVLSVYNSALYVHENKYSWVVKIVLSHSNSKPHILEEL